MNAHLASIIVCPRCRGLLQLEGDRFDCQKCAKSFAIRNGAVVFFSEPVEVVAAEHESNAIGAEYETILREGKEFVLHIGAGATATRYPNCIEFEHKIFRHTDVLGDAHRLPFRDAVFDQVFAFNVFEHLRDPKVAAGEIFRVLKPAGSVAIHTAFLQALHEEPSHFYNATEYGVREWFAQFEIENCDVSANFSPAYMMAFLMSNVLETVNSAGVSSSEQTRLGKTSIGEWASFWARRTNPPAGFGALQNLPQPLQKRIAAGFELRARKPTVGLRKTIPRQTRIG
jgi:SAM-dependent methyltransferase